MSSIFDDLLQGPDAAPSNTYRWATVTATSPEIRVRLDGEASPVGSEPAKLCPVSVGDRVWVQIHGRQLVIVGRSQ